MQLQLNFIANAIGKLLVEDLARQGDEVTSLRDLVKQCKI